MGRYYYGDIQGKFWFACQDSDDADNLGVQHEIEYANRCEYCENHEEDCDDKCDVNEDGKHNIIQQEEALTWLFTDLIDLKKHLVKYEKEFIDTAKDKKLAKSIMGWMKTFLYKDNKEIEDKFWKNSDSDTFDESILARLYLGWSIYWCIVNNGDCFITTSDF